MKLYYDRKSNDPIYYIQQGFRNGKKTSTRNVRRIGKHSELLAITDDPLAYAKEQVRLCNEEYRNKKVSLSLNIDFSEKLTPSAEVASKSSASNVGYFILQRIYHDLHIKDFFRSVVESSCVTFDCDTINRFLTFARVLDPRSKLGTFDRLGAYYEKPSFEYQHILRFMDLLAENYEGYIEHLFNNSSNVMPRNTSVCYFDCTNYYFEAETEDPDYIDEVTGEVVRGLRRYGHSKENRPAPIVQMGLFMDGDGIPISMCVTRGTESEQKCAVPLEKKMVRMFRGKRFIYCADAGIGSLGIRQYNDMGGRAFIIAQSVKKLSDEMKASALGGGGWKLLSDDTPVELEDMMNFDRFDAGNRGLYNDKAYKVIPADRAVDVGLREEKICKNGRAKTVKSRAVLRQYVIVTFSRKLQEYQRHVRKGQIDRAIRILKEGRAEEARKGMHNVRRFIKRVSKGSDGKVAVDSWTVDEQAIAEEEQYDGFYAVATNLDDNAKDILAINANRYKIEDCFRVLKTNFKARPVYHSNEKRIKAHFLICYAALLIYRLLENKLDRYGKHFTTEEILETLRNMNVVDTQGMFYTSAFGSSEVCTALNGLYGLGLDRRYYQPRELNKKLREIL